jgi:hypothetical protein
MSTLRTIHPVKHIDYSRDDRVDHLFVVGLGDDHEAILLTVSDTGVDFVMDGLARGGFSLTWAEFVKATLHLMDPINHGRWSTDRHVPPANSLTVSSTGNSSEQEQA